MTTDLSTAAWRKASKSTGGGSNCVEIARLTSVIAIRDSKNPDGGALIVSPAVFRRLLADARRASRG
jgi:hypothetical protein